MPETKVMLRQQPKTPESAPITHGPLNPQTGVEKTKIATPIDLNLVAHAKRGDIVALDTLIAQSMDKVAGYIKGHTSVDSEQVQDLTHDAMLRAVKNLKKFEPQGYTFESWLFQITRRTCADFFDASKRKVTTQSIDEELSRRMPSTPDFSGELVENLDPSNPLAQLEGLTASQRKILLLKMENFKMKDIAKEMGISKSAATQLRQRAEAAAKKALGSSEPSRSIIGNKTKISPRDEMPVLSDEAKEPEMESEQDIRGLERARIPVEDIGIYLSGMAILVGRRFIENPSEKNKQELEKFKNREAAFNRVNTERKPGEDEFIIRTIFAPEIDQIIELKKATENSQVTLI